jgi:hypothetical protein
LHQLAHLLRSSAMANGLQQWMTPRRADFLYPIFAVLLAAALYLPGLGSFGLWDPQEFQVADQAQKAVDSHDLASLGQHHPPLTATLTAAAIEAYGPSELDARLPHALLAILAVLAAYGLGRRLRGSRAGLFSAIAVATAPVFLFQARQLATDMGGIAGTAMAMYGLIGLAWPAGRPGRARAGTAIVDAVAAGLGLFLAHAAYGAVIGLAVPLCGMALASTGALTARFDREAIGEPQPGRVSHVIISAVTTAAVVIILAMWWSARDHQGYDAFLGGSFRPGPATITFDELLNDGAFGLFPWIALVPLAVLRFCFWRAQGRAAYAGLAIVGWAVASYVLGELWVREMGDLRLPGVVPCLVAVGVLLDDLLAGREGDDSRAPGTRLGGWPLFALFAVCCAIQLGRDIAEFPEQLARVHVLGTLKFPEHLGVTKTFAFLGMGFGLVAGAALSGVSRSRVLNELTRWSVPALAVIGTLGGFYLAQIYTPTLSHHYSYRNVFATYHELARPGDHLSVSGIGGAGPEFYMNGKVDRVAGLDPVLALFARPGREFVIAPATDLCPLELRAQQQQIAYHVLDAENSRYFLFGNQLPAGYPDVNPLRHMIYKERPTSVGTPLAFTFKPPGGGEIELIGVDMPARAKKRSTFKMRLYFHVVQEWHASYKLLVHFDRRVRFQADHQPLGGLCGTQYWQAGTYVVDEFDVTAGELTSPKGEWEVFTGFFTGEAGNWKNVPVTSGNGGKDDRVDIGKIVVY